VLLTTKTVEVQPHNKFPLFDAHTTII